MNVHQRSPRESDNLDALLRGFFRSEMPDPWPAWKAPNQGKPTSSARRWTAVRSKLALAASVALLLLGSWWLSGGPSVDYSQRPGVSPLGDHGSASGSGVKNLLHGRKPGVAPTKSPNSRPGCDCCE